MQESPAKHWENKVLFGLVVALSATLAYQSGRQDGAMSRDAMAARVQISPPPPAVPTAAPQTKPAPLVEVAEADAPLKPLWEPPEIESRLFAQGNEPKAKNDATTGRTGDNPDQPSPALGGATARETPRAGPSSVPRAGELPRDTQQRLAQVQQIRVEQPARATLRSGSPYSPVQRYFLALDMASAGQNTPSDPKKFASGALNNALKADGRDLRELIEQREDLLQKMNAVVPPPSCRKYHKKAVALVADSLSLLKQVFSIAQQKDNLQALPALANGARDLMLRAQALDEEAAQLQGATLSG